MIIMQPQRRGWRGSGLEWMNDGPALELTGDALYRYWLPHTEQFIHTQINDDGIGLMALPYETKRAEIVTDDITEVQCVFDKLRLCFANGSVYRYKQRMMMERTP